MDSEETEENIAQEIDPQEWLGHVTNLLIMGEPFFTNGNLTLGFTTDTEIFTVNATRKPNNVVPFPVKKQQK